MYGGYFSSSEITDIDDKYIGSVIDLETLTKMTRQMKISMGGMMWLVSFFAVLIFAVLVYLLSKLSLKKMRSRFPWQKFSVTPKERLQGSMLCQPQSLSCSAC